MNCPQIQSWLLDCDNLREDSSWPIEIHAHIAGCASCKSFRTRLSDIEGQFRSLPTTIESAAARDRFLSTLRVVRPAESTVPSKTNRRYALAASILLLIGLSSWFLAPPAQLRAASDIVEQLVDWNLALADEADAEARLNLYDAESSRFRTAVREAKLAPDDGELAQSLLDKGGQLAAVVDPMDGVDHFSDVADQLLEQMDGAAKKQNLNRLDRLSRLYGRITEMGINVPLAREEVKVSADARRGQKRAAAAKRKESLILKFEAVLARVPPKAREKFLRNLAAPERPAKPGKRKVGSASSKNVGKF